MILKDQYNSKKSKRPHKALRFSTVLEFIFIVQLLFSFTVIKILKCYAIGNSHILSNVKILK